MTIEDVLCTVESLGDRVSILEKALNTIKAGNQNVLKLDLILPEVDISGLHFNETKVRAVFDKRENGWYYNRDILFLSARNTDPDNERDILAEYLNSCDFRNSVRSLLPEGVFGEVMTPDTIEISLSRKTEGRKKYNGVEWRY
jgi:hypothetical protein